MIFKMLILVFTFTFTEFVQHFYMKLFIFTVTSMELKIHRGEERITTRNSKRILTWDVFKLTRGRHRTFYKPKLPEGGGEDEPTDMGLIFWLFK